LKRQIIPYARQEIHQNDIEAVVAVLRSDLLTQGPSIPAFEQAVASSCGAKHAVAVNSATSALHMACLALGVGPGDVVWTSPISFVASANCALYCGAKVDFVDIDPRTYNLSADCLAEKLAKAKKEGVLPKVVIPVHLCGQPCDMARIHTLGREYGFRIIEDASHAIGGKYQGEPIGNCRYSDITVFSFHPVKIITTGEGGMLMTQQASLDKRLRLLRSHGISALEEDGQIRPKGEIWNYQQIDLGFNYRMTDIQAALGLSQMKRLDEFVARRHVLAAEYNLRLSKFPVVVPWQHPVSHSSYHLYVIRLQLDKIKKSHRQVYDELFAAGVRVNLHYIPVYRHPYFEKMGFKSGYCPQAERYYAEAISIPLFPGLSETQQQQVIQEIASALQ